MAIFRRSVDESLPSPYKFDKQKEIDDIKKWSPSRAEGWIFVKIEKLNYDFVCIKNKNIIEHISKPTMFMEFNENRPSMYQVVVGVYITENPVNESPIPEWKVVTAECAELFFVRLREYE